MTLSKLFSKYSKNSRNIVYVYPFQSPVGKVISAADDEFLYNVSFELSKNFEKQFEKLHSELSCKFVKKKNALLQKFELELAEYFHGKLERFTVPFKTFGSAFQKAVWNKLLELPYASTQSYGDLAKALGRPKSHSRAVGAACGANAHVLVIPCHRLVASGSIGGFSCGVDRKEWLIEHEKKHTN